MKKIAIPLSVPRSKHNEFKKNMKLLTKGTGNLFLIAGDQKIEHLNNDFYGPKIAIEDSNPEHLFKIAAASEGGILATQLGLISRYGQKYSKLPYIIKINSKSNLGPNAEKNSSQPLWSVDDILTFKRQTELKIAAIGYTIYLGGKYEAQMLTEAAQTIFKAHQAGLAAIIWMYPRGNKIKEEDIHTIAGGAGVATCLDADFIKVKYPYKRKDRKTTAQAFKEVISASGNSRIICVGGSKQPAKDLLSFLNLQLKVSGSSGLAIGRNLHQRSPQEAYNLAKAISAMILKGSSLNEAIKIYNNKIKQKKVIKSKFLGFF
jgi:fructose-bisphosphate aldolase / 6-deoxy-5-ketofructose 1-phosphate synthase